MVDVDAWVGSDIEIIMVGEEFDEVLVELDGSVLFDEVDEVVVCWYAIKDVEDVELEEKLVDDVELVLLLIVDDTNDVVDEDVELCRYAVKEVVEAVVLDEDDGDEIVEAELVLGLDVVDTEVDNALLDVEEDAVEVEVAAEDKVVLERVLVVVDVVLVA